jgi:hypothetical protein
MATAHRRPHPSHVIGVDVMGVELIALVIGGMFFGAAFTRLTN